MTYAEITPIETWVKPMKDESGNFDFTEVDRAQSRNYTQGSKIQMVRVITPAGTSAQQVKITDGTNLLEIESNGSLKVGTSVTGASNSTVANNNTQTIYTVPVGKTARIYSYGLQSTAVTGGGGTTNSSIVINGVTVLRHSDYAVSSQHSSMTVHNLGSNYIEITAGQTVTVVSSAIHSLAYGSITYYEF